MGKQGLRQGEAIGLTWDRVDRARGVLVLEVTKSGLLGHSSLAMTVRYAHLAPEHLRKAAATLDGLLVSTKSAHAPSVADQQPIRAS